MLTRTADSLYWMSRNIERAEKIAGILSTELTNVLESSDKDDYIRQELDMVLGIAASHEITDQLVEKNELSMKSVANHLLFAGSNDSSIYNCIRIARENARTCRDQLSNDFWVIINEFHLTMMAARTEPFSVTQIQHLLQRVKMTSLSAQGIIESTVTRGMDYRMIKIGKWVERADFTVRILLAVCQKAKQFPEQTGYYMSLALQLINGSNAYLKQNRPMMQPKAVIPFILNEANFPCSVMYCIEKKYPLRLNVSMGSRERVTRIT